MIRRSEIEKIVDLPISGIGIKGFTVPVAVIYIKNGDRVEEIKHAKVVDRKRHGNFNEVLDHEHLKALVLCNG